jgi:hypothetical protein
MLRSNRYLHKNTLAIVEGIGQIGAVARIVAGGMIAAVVAVGVMITVTVLTVAVAVTIEAGDQTAVEGAAAGATTN